MIGGRFCRAGRGGRFGRVEECRGWSFDCEMKRVCGVGILVLLIVAGIVGKLVVFVRIFGEVIGEFIAASTIAFGRKAAGEVGGVVAVVGVVVLVVQIVGVGAGGRVVEVVRIFGEVLGDLVAASTIAFV
jgi:hypothetical protein